MWMSAVLLVPLLPLLTSLIVVAGSGAARHRVNIADNGWLNEPATF